MVVVNKRNSGRTHETGLTASTTQTQGNGSLTANINEVSTVANIGDVVTLPAAAPGLQVIVINNGSKRMNIFPATGDDLGEGTNTSVSLASGSSIIYLAHDSTNWESV